METGLPLFFFFLLYNRYNIEIIIKVRRRGEKGLGCVWPRRIVPVRRLLFKFLFKREAPRLASGFIRTSSRASDYFRNNGILFYFILSPPHPIHTHIHTPQRAPKSSFFRILQGGGGRGGVINEMAFPARRKNVGLWRCVRPLMDSGS